jgi:hypothetical protein
MWKFSPGFSLLFVAVFACSCIHAQTKTYLTVGVSSYSYSTKSEALNNPRNKYFVGLEVDKYISYHYAITTGASLVNGGYDNGVSKWNNRFVRVPLYIKSASLGETIGLFVGLDFNILVKSTLNEAADTLGNRVTTNVTAAFPRVQPDFTFGLAYRLKRITVGMKYSLALTNRYSMKVKDLTDQNNVYYGSWYAYSKTMDDHRLKASVIQVYLSVRIL